ncbi:chemotaxis response regulator protein-glutamate methylesterase [Permianibacter sp. IMCC34836]|uniref:protein-glutamate methylesterase/protein-glutamine glutaminase n=1 Tax=Permianibacter fluminis TaxID=2738515 RepID=UPI0015561572|nr:chemotaxis response regulator protein-glutamate methylesterase [Permianibacter fluminis]NQD38015.1 chemotaxis response regulator protein-glutamate methylesterase [Permianibacter fluminis]
MAVRVLVVDDSNFFCRRVVEILKSDPGIQVVGVANNGLEAVKKSAELKPDVITMDVEMPVMDGITATKQIVAQQSVAVLMLSSLTYEGARMTLDAMSAGAVDFLLKSYEDVQGNQSNTANLLREKVKAIGLQQQRRSGGAFRTAAPAPAATSSSSTPGSSTSSSPAPVAELRRPATAPTGAGSAPAPAARSTPAADSARPEPAKQTLRRGNTKLVAIGSSTGGPVALQQVLTPLPQNFPVPIVIAQHMPGTFTPAFAQRLDGLCNVRVKEAADGDVLQAGHVYLAPGGKQMTLEGQGGQLRVRIRETDARLQYAPCVDVLFGSAANLLGGNVVAVVLTGMGADGREGSRLLRDKGSTIWSQDEASCVVYGMPQAVAAAGISHQVVALTEIGRRLAAEI